MSALIRKQEALDALGDTPCYPTPADTLQAAHEIINSLPEVDAVPKWVSVKERLPEESDLYMTVIKKHSRKKAVCYYNTLTGNWYIDVDKGIERVTCWVKCWLDGTPEPPEED